MKSRDFLVTASLAAALLSATVGAGAATLDVAVFHSERDAYSVAFRYWMDEVAERTDGRVRFRPHYAGGLVAARETLGAVRDGVVPLGVGPASFMSGQLAALSSLEVPGWLPGMDQPAVEVMDKAQPILESIFRKGDVEYLWMQPAFSMSAFCGNKFLRTAEDWAGTKVRTAGRWTARYVTGMGGVPVTTDTGELYVALQNKTVDCVLLVKSLAASARLNEVAPKVTDLGLTVNAVVYLANPRDWARLSERDRQIVREVSKEAQRRSVAILLKAQEQAESDMKEKDASFAVLDEPERNAMVKMLGAMQDEIRKSGGDDAARLVDLLRPYW